MIRAGPVLLCGAQGYRDSVNQIKGNTIMAIKQPRRLTSKMEAFARAVALENQSLADAYRAAYDTAKMQANTIQTEASKLAAHPAVSARVQVLKGRAEAAIIRKAVLTVEQSLDEAASLLKDAQDLGQISAGVAAATLRAKLSGLLVEKPAEKGSALDSMDVEDLLEMRKEVEARIQRAKEALDLVGEAPLAPAAHRRVIN